MPMIASEKKLKKMVDPLLQDGESITGITFQGGFKKLCLAATDNHRLLITTLPFFGSKATLTGEIHFRDIEAIDLNPAANYGYLHIKTDEETLNYKIASGLFDTFSEAFNIYSAVIKLNADAAPEYLPDDEDVTFMISHSDGIIKLTEKQLLFLDLDKKTMTATALSSTESSAIDSVDFYPSKLTASFFRITINGSEKQLKLGMGLTARGSILEAMSGKVSLSSAAELYERIIQMNPNARPPYLEPDEVIRATARVGHGMFTVSGGNLLRATGARLMELEINKTGPMTLKENIPYDAIRNSKLTKVNHNNSVQYELKIQTDDKKYKFVAPDDYAEAMDAIYELLPG